MDPASPTFQLARHVVETLQQHGHTAYFAGGCVRDMLLGKPPKDYDVATAARPEQVLQLFPRGQQVGAAFGVILIRHHKAQVEVATFRTDGTYHDGRHPVSVQFSTPEADAQRRDFTCNGLFYDPRAQQVLDFVAGQADIAAKVLRAIGDPAQRFAEDHLRLLRAARFATRLDFSIDPATANAIRSAAPHIARISRERIGEELRLMLEAPTRAASMRLLAQLGLLRAIWPPIVAFADAVDFPTLAALHSPAPRWLGLLATQIDLAQMAGEPSADLSTAARALRAAFMLSNAETEAIAWAAERWMAVRTGAAGGDARWKRTMADGRWPDVANLLRAGEIPNRHDLEALWARLSAEGVAPAPWVTGEDLIAMGAVPGRAFKRWLDELYDRQLEREFPDRAAAHAAARALIAQSNQP